MIRLSTLAALVLANGGIARATDYHITYTGTVSGSDTAGVFGSAGMLSGTYTLVYDLVYPTPGSSDYQSGNVRSIYGGTFDSESDPLSAILTIGGQSYSFSGPYYGEADFWGASSEPGNFNGVADYAYGNDNGTAIANYIQSSLNSILTTTNLYPFSYSAQSGDTAAGSFTISENGYIAATGNLTPQNVTMAAVDAVPEPATWAMMLFGFGAIGLSMRKSCRGRLAFAPR